MSTGTTTIFCELNRVKLRPVDPHSLAVPADAIDPPVRRVTDGLGFQGLGLGVLGVLRFWVQGTFASWKHTVKFRVWLL